MHLRTLATAAVGLACLAVTATGTAAVAGHVAFADGPFGVHQAGVDFVSDARITGGCGDGARYCPGDAVSRAQMATFLHRLSGNAPSTAPSVNADRLDGLHASAFLGQVTAVEAEFTEGSGDVACPVGTSVVGGGYVQYEGFASVAVVDAQHVDAAGVQHWLVGLVDPTTKEYAGEGVVQALCAHPAAPPAPSPSR